MKPAEKKSIFRQLFLTLWAMVTLVLCFVVGLLINEMLKSGNDPLAALSPDTDTPALPSKKEPPVANSLGTKEVALYFADESGEGLAAESLVIEYQSHTVENCRAALQGLISGPQSALLIPVVPEKTQMRALYLRADGELTVDISSEMVAAQTGPRSAEMEALMVYVIVNTLTQPILQAPDDTAVDTVRFLFDGAPPQESFPAHLDLSAPLKPDAYWTRTGAE